MPRGTNLGKIEKEVEKLTPQEQLKLVEKLAHNLRMTGLAVKKELDWKNLYGLGKGLWKGEDARCLCLFKPVSNEGRDFFFHISTPSFSTACASKE